MGQSYRTASCVTAAPKSDCDGSLSGRSEQLASAPMAPAAIAARRPKRPLPIAARQCFLHSNTDKSPRSPRQTMAGPKLWPGAMSENWPLVQWRKQCVRRSSTGAHKSIEPRAGRDIFEKSKLSGASTPGGKWCRKGGISRLSAQWGRSRSAAWRPGFASAR